MANKYTPKYFNGGNRIYLPGEWEYVDGSLHVVEGDEALVVETEGLNDEGRKNVASVFYNRLDLGMSLGSDVTTYYAAGIDMGERDLYQAEIDAVNAYNTRPGAMAGKLPIGAICNPSISSIEAAVKPNKTSYLYFVADKNGKVYFTKTLAEHNQIINELKTEGLWFTY